MNRRSFLRGIGVTVVAVLAKVGIAGKPSRVLTTALGHEVPITGDLVTGKFTAEAWVRADGRYLDDCYSIPLRKIPVGWTSPSPLVRHTGDVIELPLMLPHDAQDGDLHHCVWYWDDEGPIDGKWI